MEPQLSVIIPTHKRADILWRCLEHLEKQTIKDQIEVIVVSDGHDPKTAELFERQSESWKIPVTFFEIEKSQQGVARNRGVAKAKAPYVLFIGDDIFLLPEACEHHMKAHERAQKEAKTNQVAVLGFTTWDPAVGMTPVMHWLEKTGWQFGYPMIEKYAKGFIPTDLQHRFTYTSNFSLPTVLAHKILFREDVKLYGWEDTEWGLRLRDAGVKLYYEPAARGLHHHHIALPMSLERMETLGRSAVIVSKLNPQLDRLPKGWKAIAYKVISYLPTMRGRHAKAFLRGINS